MSPRKRKLRLFPRGQGPARDARGVRGARPSPPAELVIALPHTPPQPTPPASPQSPAVAARGLVPVGRSVGGIERAADPDDVLHALQGERKAGTNRKYEHALNELAAFIGEPDAGAAARAVLALGPAKANRLAVEWLVDMRRRGLKPNTVKVRFGALRSMLKVARRLGLVNWTVEIALPRPVEYKDTRGCGTEAAELVIARLAREGTPLARRNAAMLALLFYQGLRRSEVVGLDFEHLDAERGRLSIFGKARHEREVIDLSPAALQLLVEWTAARGTEPGPMFPALDRTGRGGRLSGGAVWKMTTSRGLGRPHGLRHSGITAVLDKSNGDLRAAMAFGRHWDANITMKYDDNRKGLAGKMATLIGPAVPGREVPLVASGPPQTPAPAPVKPQAPPTPARGRSRRR